MKALMTRFFIYVWAILVIFIGYGMFLSKEQRSTVSVTLPVAPQELWTVLQAVEEYPKWWSELEAAQPIENLPSGKQVFALQFKNGDWIHYSVKESRQPEQWSFEMEDRNQPFSGSWTYRLSPQDSSTHLEIIEDAINKTAMLRTYKQVFSSHDKTIQSFAYQLKAHLHSRSALGGKGT